MITVAINGAGRIGRAVARLLLNHKTIELTAINDLADEHTIKYLLRYDSIHKKALDLNLDDLVYSSCKSPKECSFGAVDVVVEATGRFVSSSDVKPFIDGGAKMVIITAPTNDGTRVIRSSYQTIDCIVSAGSCTTNALDLIVGAIESEYAVEAVLATSIHSYTSDQRLLDGAHPFELRRARSATQNIIPVATGAAKNLIAIHSSLEGRCAAIGLRVPTPNGSIMQSVFLLSSAVSKEKINQTFEQFASKLPANQLAVSYEHKCLVDIIGTSYSAIVDGNLTMVQDRLLGITAWHDNEYGYASKVVALIETNISKE